MVGIVTLPWVAGMAILAAFLLGVQGSYVGTLLLIMIASYLGVTAGYAVNDYWDYLADLSNPYRLDKAANHGLKRGTLRSYAVLLGLPSILIMYYLSFYAFLIAIIQMVCIYLYSSRYKRTSPHANWLVVIATALMPIAVFFVYTNYITKVAVMLAAAYFFFEPGFTWSGVCRDVAFDKKMGYSTLPRKIGVHKTSIYILETWMLLLLVTIALYMFTALGLVFFIGAVFAAFWLILAAVKFADKPTPQMGGATFMKATLWFWIFSVSIMLDVAANIPF
jgi:4-hydroxybenzoate polyprenyltransferase